MGRAFEYRRASKEKRWDKMSRVFPKLGRAIYMAAREGGLDPNSNSKLNAAIMTAKAQNMPLDNVEAAIKRAAGKDATAMAEVNYEGKGPHGVMLFVETATDNVNRTVANIKLAFNKNGGQTVPTGALEFMFNRKSVVEFKIAEGAEMDEIELSLIDGGLEDLVVHEGVGYITAGFVDFGKITKCAEELGLEITKATVQRIPTSPIELTEEQLEEVEKIIDALEEDEDVQAVYTNIA
jgi:YebC/PmpR family DNA-binding regulatory protein